jgi:hypothetical protein
MPKQKAPHITKSATDSPINLDAHIQAAAKVVLGEPVRAIAREHDIGQNQLRRAATICGISVEDFRERVRGKTQEILDQLADTLPEAITALRPMDRFIAYGITMDKYRDLTGGTVPASVHITNVQINGSNRSDALAALTGSRKAVKALEAHQESQGDTLDAEATTSLKDQG